MGKAGVRGVVVGVGWEGLVGWWSLVPRRPRRQRCGSGSDVGVASAKAVLQVPAPGPQATECWLQRWRDLRTILANMLATKLIPGSILHTNRKKMDP